VTVAEFEGVTGTIRGTWNRPANATDGSFKRSDTGAVVEQALCNTASNLTLGTWLSGARAIEQRLSEVVDFARSKNWDTYGATPVAAAWAATVGAWLSHIAAATRTRPDIDPTPAGGLRAAWESPRGFVEVTLDPLSTPEIEIEIDGEGDEWPMRGNAEFSKFLRMLWLLNA